jgi:hypothetical protein
VGFGEIGVLGGDDHGTVPLLHGIVGAQTVGDHVSLADVAAGVAQRVVVITKQEIHSCSGCLVPLEQIGQIRAAAGQHMARPVGDLGSRHTAGRAVDEEQLDLLAAHGLSTATSSTVRTLTVVTFLIKSTR